MSCQEQALAIGVRYAPLPPTKTGHAIHASYCIRQHATESSCQGRSAKENGYTPVSLASQVVYGENVDNSGEETRFCCT